MDLFEAIRKRRSVRAFKPDPVSEELLNKILEAAQWAPSAGNCQARDFIIIRNPEMKKELCAAALHEYMIEEAPVNIVVCANEERSARRYGDRGRKLYCLMDAAAATQNMLLAVHALGLGACWIGAFRDEEVAEALNLPEWLRPVAIIPVGYPAEKPWPTPRIPLEELVHREQYRAERKSLPRA